MKQFNQSLADFWQDYAALVMLAGGLLGVLLLIGFTIWAIIVYIVWRVLRRRPVGAVREAVYGVVAFVALLVVYALAVVMPRPMARLVKTRIDIIAADFHSHTRYSHDGRPGWSAPARRRSSPRCCAPRR